MITVNGNTVAHYFDNQNVFPQVVALFRSVYLSSLLSDPISSLIPSISSFSLPAPKIVAPVASVIFTSPILAQVVIHEDSSRMAEKEKVIKAKSQQTISRCSVLGEGLVRSISDFD